MMFSPDGPPALPLWINGRSFLTMVPDFFEIQNALTGEPLRRTPLCGADEVAAAVQSAQSAQSQWAASPRETRQKHLEAWAKSLDQYMEHFAKLIREETGKSEEAALAEVRSAIAALESQQASPADDQGKIVALACDDSAPLAQAAKLMAPVLRDGGTIIFKPSPKAPGAIYALMELSSRSDLIPGVLNLVQGDDQVLKAMFANPHISRLAFSGHAQLGEKIRAMAANSSLALSVESPSEN